MPFINFRPSLAPLYFRSSPVASPEDSNHPFCRVSAVSHPWRGADDPVSHGPQPSHARLPSRGFRPLPARWIRAVKVHSVSGGVGISPAGRCVSRRQTFEPPPNRFGSPSACPQRCGHRRAGRSPYPRTRSLGRLNCCLICANQQEQVRASVCREFKEKCPRSEFSAALA